MKALPSTLGVRESSRLFRHGLPGQTTPLRLSPDSNSFNAEGYFALSNPDTGEPKYLIAEIGTELLFWPIPDDDYTAYLTVAILPRFPMAVPEYGTDISFDSATKQIRRAAGSFITHGYQVGATVNVNGSTSNDGDYTITHVWRKLR